MSRPVPTPGPWRAQAGLVVSGATHCAVAQVYAPASLVRWPENAAERDANARLMAAAPEMADALRHVAVLARNAILHQRDLDKAKLLAVAEQALQAAETALRQAGLDDAL